MACLFDARARAAIIDRAPVRGMNVALGPHYLADQAGVAVVVDAAMVILFTAYLVGRLNRDG